MSFLRLAFRNSARPCLAARIPRPQNSIPWRASFSATSGLPKETIQTRVLDVLKGFEKVDPSKVSPYPFIPFPPLLIVTEQLSTTASFTEDLGLDSLDAVEVVMAVEEVWHFFFCELVPTNRICTAAGVRYRDSGC
jgi:NADH dehydrogenase (ubiquinone) 1 alpha/beta subcomplex 1, acyl-carrier protein